MANLNFFRRKAVNNAASMRISLQAIIGRTSITFREYVEKQVLAGVTPDAIKKNLQADLASNGRIFGEFRRAVKATTEGAIGKQSTDAYLAEFGTEIRYNWIAALVNTCKDCIDRHGEVKTYEEWEDLGLPRSGWSVCRENCQCVLVPEEMAQERTELTAPLDRRGARDRLAANRARFNPEGA